MTTLFAAIVLLGVFVFVHELGHYLAARSIGVKVERFSVGFPPRLMTYTSVVNGWEFRLFFYKKNKSGKYKWGSIYESMISIPGRKGTSTEYCLAIIPFGGYVKVAGIIDERMDKKYDNKPYELMSKSKWKQIWFQSAGVIMNLILAFIIFTGLSNYSGRIIPSTMPIINEVIENMPAQKSGLKVGDIIQSVNGQPIETWSELTKEIHQRPNQEIDIIYRRGVKKLNILLSSTFQINPSNGDTIGIIGIQPEYQNVPVNLIESMNIGATATIRGFGMAILTIKMLTSGQASMKELGGPIMIAQLAGQTAEAGWIPFLTLMALISCNIAFINILPIPGLDGGHIFITLIEGIIRKPLTFKMRMAIQQVGMLLILMLMVTVIVKDVGRLFEN